MLYTAQQIKLHAREIGDLVADKLERHEEKLRKLESRLTAIEAAQQAPAQVPAVTVEDCVRAMEVACDMLGSICKVGEGELLNVRWNDPIDIQVMRILRTAIKQAKEE